MFVKSTKQKCFVLVYNKQTKKMKRSENCQQITCNKNTDAKREYKVQISTDKPNVIDTHIS